MGHALVGSKEISPWEALLGEVRRTAAEVAWLDMKVSQAPNDESLISGAEGGFAPWVKMRNEQRAWLGRISKMALDAGVAERMVAQVELEGQKIAGIIMTTLNALHLNDDQWDVARSILRQQLLAVNSHQMEIEGEVINDAAERSGTND